MTANELAFVRAESDLTMPFRRGADISVRPAAAPGTWQAKCSRPIPCAMPPSLPALNDAIEARIISLTSTAPVNLAPRY